MTTWTAERDQRLLLLLLANVRPDVKILAEKWKAKYVDQKIDDFEPTPIALRKHIAALKERAQKNQSGKGSKLSATAGVKKTTAAAKKTKTKSPAKTARKSKSKKIKEEDEDASEELDDAVATDEAEMTNRETDEEMVLNTPSAGPRRASNRAITPSKIKLEADANVDLDDQSESGASEASSFSPVKE